MQHEQAQRAAMRDDMIVRRSADGVLDVRAETFRLRLSFDNLRAAGGDDLQCNFECSAKVADGRSDPAMLVESLLHDGKTFATTTDAASYLVRASLPKIAEEVSIRGANEWLTGPGTEDLKMFIVQRVDAAAFACGLQTMSPFALDARSNSFERKQLEERQRAAAEARNIERIEHLRRAGALLSEFEQLRARTGNEPADAVLQRLAPADRGAMFEATLLAGARNTASKPLWAVAGASLFRIDVSTNSPTLHPIELPSTLGPLRSVQWSGRVLLIGAQSGVWCVDPESSTSARPFAVPSAAGNFGFNAAFIDAGALVASHAEHGVIAWTMDDESAPPRTIAQRANARLLNSLGAGRAIFCADTNSLEVACVDRDERRTVSLPDVRLVAAIIMGDSRIFVVGDDRRILTIDRQSLDVISNESRPGARVLSAAGLPWLESTRLLLARDGGPIDCVGVDDPLVTQYCSPHQSIKIVAASADVVAAVSSDRQRLILWRAWDGRAPFAEINLTAIARHRIADIDFA